MDYQNCSDCRYYNRFTTDLPCCNCEHEEDFTKSKFIPIFGDLDEENI